jgi:energy-coupling factor transport system permease protein
MAIEFSRNITFGQYLDLGSPVHRLDPRIKIVSTAALMVALLLARSFVAVGVIFLAAVLIQTISRIPVGYTLRGMRLLANTMLIIFTFQVLFFRGPEPPIWSWWIVSISWSGIMQGLLTLARVLLLYYLTTTLMFTTALMDLADGFEIMLDPFKRIGLPINELVMTMVVALKFVPLLVSEVERLVKAQAARGASIDHGGVAERARNLAAVLIPLFVGALARAETLTTAMDARCYRGGRGRTKRRVLILRPPDLLALALALLFAAASMLAARLLSFEF